MRFVYSLTTLAASVAVVIPAMAADIAPLEPVVFEEMHTGKPAVSALNGKLEVGFAWAQYELFEGVDDDEVNANNVYGVGSVSMPAGERFGIQVDLGISQGFEDEVGPGGFLEVDHGAYGVGGHFFWRDPDVALVGLYAHYLRVNRDTSIAATPITFARQTDVIRVAAAGEYYLDSFSLEGHAGADFMRTTLDVFGTDLTDTGTFLNARGVAAYYPTDNARIFAGARYAFEEFSGVAGAEVMFASENPVAPAMFVEGSLGQETASVNAGLRFYFGAEGKSLKRRHREDDPAAQIFNDLGALNACSSSLSDPAFTELVGYDYYHQDSQQTNGPKLPESLPGSSCGLTVDPQDLADIEDPFFGPV